MVARVTAGFAQTISLTSVKPRVTQVFAQCITGPAVPEPRRVTQVFAQALSLASVKPRVTQVFAQVLDVEPVASMSRRRQMYIIGS